MGPHTKYFVARAFNTQEKTLFSQFDAPPSAGAYPKEFSPQITTIVLDLHGVLFSSSIPEIISIIWHCPHKLKFLRLITNIPLAHTVVDGVLKKYVIEQLIQELSQKHHLFDYFKDTALAVANAQKINLRMLSLLQDLHAKNYQLVAFSNIGERSIEILSTRYPEVFKLFSHVIYTSAHDNYAAKPDIKAFNKLFQYANPASKKIILIDDTYKNIWQAHALGLFPIPFTGTRSLKQTLIQLNIIKK